MSELTSWLGLPFLHGKQRSLWIGTPPPMDRPAALQVGVVDPNGRGSGDTKYNMVSKRVWRATTYELLPRWGAKPYVTGVRLELPVHGGAWRYGASQAFRHAEVCARWCRARATAEHSSIEDLAAPASKGLRERDAGITTAAKGIGSRSRERRVAVRCDAWFITMFTMSFPLVSDPHHVYRI
ncbi:hypothetical protein PVAP13_9KG349183 [Panicum virgatum]|uniref:Uncharacterized protein n=1 Tax=Panicum virgatum TaxID=38727 RepID=A0A8T0NQY4_PANVG|nr:hypothetical protein PVAP13_9KG349183 [Panicum virgatum]